MNVPVQIPKPFAFEARVRDGRSEILVEGELDLASAERFAEALEAAARQGLGVSVDLGRCEFIDSTGIALILRARRQLEAAGLALRVDLDGAPRQVRRLFEIAGLLGTPLVAPAR